MKQLGWCSIEQSQKLIEAGLDPNTADMYYFKDQLSLIYCNADYNDIFKWFNVDGMSNNLTPCWSLGALIGLLPKTIETKKPKNLYFSEILPANNCVAYTALNERKEMVFLKMFATGVESDATLIDNMVLMICCLLENNYIKKGN